MRYNSQLEISRAVSLSAFEVLYTWKVNSTNRGLNFNLTFTYFASLGGDFMQSLAFLIHLVITCFFDALNLVGLFQIYLVISQILEEGTL